MERLNIRTGMLLFADLSFNGDIPSTVSDLRAVPGDSGSPIVDQRGRLVGVVWGIGLLNGLTWSVPYGEVARVVDGALHRSGSR